MPASRLLQLLKDDDLGAFESLCLELLESEGFQLAELVAPFEELDRRSAANLAGTLGQMVLEAADTQADPAAALSIARIALLSEPGNDQLRGIAVKLYRQVHGDRPGFAELLEMSGLESGRPARNALGILSVCLSLAPGDTLASRVEDIVAEVLEIDLAHGLIMLQHAHRRKTITPLELSSEYERVAPDDFRVLRAFKPERIAELLESDPVAVVIGLIRAHGERIDQDMLKHELVGKHISPKDWSKWWTRARKKLNRSPHVIVEGRAPVMLRYTAEARTLEDATWETFEQQSDPSRWLATLEGYLREKRSHKEEPEAGLLARCHARLDDYGCSIEHKRPSEALGCALVGEMIDEVVSDLGDDSKGRAAELFRNRNDPAALVAGQESETLWVRALAALGNARPDDAATRAVELVPIAPAGLLDRIVAMAREAGVLELVQTHIDTALADPVDYPELVFWLWKGPKPPAGLRLPTEDVLFSDLVRTLSALGRTLNPSPDVTRRFRLRMRTAMSLRNYARARDCLHRTPADRAVTLRTQLDRLEGLGDNARNRLLDLLRDAHPALWAAPRRRVEPWEDPDVLWSTAAGIRRKTQERDHLVNVTMRENGRRIGEAASHGDLSENSEYKFALEERDFLRARLAQMNNELSITESIEPDAVPADHVGVGSRITLRDLADDSMRVMTFLGPFDADVDAGIFNYKAPVSLELMGSRVGDRITLTVNDRECEYEVTAIANGLQTSQA